MNRNRCLVLLMRVRFISVVDHIQAALGLGIELHVVTVPTTYVADDPRFASVLELPADSTAEDFVDASVRVARERGAAAVFTFIENDIILAEIANDRLGNTWGSVEAARISRDKQRQREFMRDNDVPSVWFHPVSDVEDAVAAATAHGLPLIVKPTRAAASEYVELIHDVDRLRGALVQIRGLAERRRLFYYDGEEQHWALLEEYLPGEEVTLDGVVLDGQFILGGVHNKFQSSGPFFAEDFYTLPFGTPEREEELVGVTKQIVAGLGIQTCLFNVELRQDAEGRYRVVEFSTRGSGGHPYRHIKDVYTIDLARMYLRAACGEPVQEILAQENERSDPRMTVCAKVIYANGHVVRNSVGEAIHSPYLRVYWPVAKPGTDVVAGARGIDFTGLLSVWMPWRPGQSPERVHEAARHLAGLLDVEIRPDGSDV